MIEILELLDHFKGKAYFVDGTTASGMGIIDYPFDHSDLKFLLIDEIDKLSKKDQKVLLNVMETGILSIQNSRYTTPFPDHYYDDSFKLISQGSMNHIRYVFYWEAYEKNPSQFVKEIKKVANLADKWGLKVVYDSHQFHTSSWLDPKNGTGFPPELFQGDPDTPMAEVEKR